MNYEVDVDGIREAIKQEKCSFFNIVQTGGSNPCSKIML